MDLELLSDLKKCLDRYWRTMSLPLEQRAPFAAGIAKLETRIEQLRAATGKDTDQLILRIQSALVPLHDGHDYPKLFDHVGHLLDQVGACWKVGDQPGAKAALSELEACVKHATQGTWQEVLSL